ncbi:hypothetical protein TWF694_009679 [Orbilia ellipsospora]|uniref:Uncharacterized protein n=1 Tax=Orbilia ellipsospora TaxID=2528407 RepID=A0AAV9XBI2_9PEZI
MKVVGPCIALMGTCLVYFASLALSVPTEVFEPTHVIRREPRFKSMEELAKTFNLTLDKLGNHHSGRHVSNIENKISSDLTKPRSLFRRNNDWEYICYKKPGGNPEAAWAGAYNYACDRLQEMKGQKCTLAADQQCATCYCISNASIQLCRGSGTGEISVDKHVVGFNGNEVVRQFLRDVANETPCGNDGCTDTNCQYFGLAAHSGLNAPWHISLDGAACPSPS